MDHLDLTVLNFMKNPFGLKRVIIIQVNFNTFDFFLELNHCLLKTGCFLIQVAAKTGFTVPNFIWFLNQEV